jgi:uncharacterized membrane protein (DUF485 family)
MIESRPEPVAGLAAGIARGALQPGHHRLTEKEWEAIEVSPDFQSLYRDKLRFIIPAAIFFLAYYFGLPVLVGYAPGLMSTKLIGEVNLAYVFALSQFVMAWTLMYLYVRSARRWDGEASRVIKDVNPESAI